MLTDKSIASLCLGFPGKALIIIVKGKKPVKELQMRLDDKQNKRMYKLDKLRIKKGIIIG